jgi:hypothetical protein
MPKAKETTQLYQYRVLENDDAGDPLDHGVVRAASVDAAKVFVRERLAEVLTLDARRAYVRLYPLKDVKRGVLPPAGEDLTDFWGV